MPINPRLTEWQGRVCWIVGASTGIGRATAEALQARGARVAVSARDAAALDGFVAAHPGSLALPLDVDHAAAVRAAAERIAAEWGRIDFSLYCAGYYRPQRATAFELEEALRHQRVNVQGCLHWLAALLPRLVAARAGHLSLVASVAGYRALPHALAYGPTKAALIHLAEGLHLDLAPLGIGVSRVCPGFVETPLTAQNAFRMPALITPEQAAAAMLQGWARGRFEIHFPKRFTLVLKALRLLPQGAYEALVRRATGL